jgi:hypothetical protein
MRRFVGVFVLLAGCASTNEYVPGPPTTVREPIYSGEVRPRQRVRQSSVEAAPLAGQPSYPPANEPSLPVPEPRAPMTSRLTEWLCSGRGWVWGAARHGPIRDEALDRSMADTLTSSRPGYLRDSGTTSAPLIPETWIYPSR